MQQNNKNGAYEKKIEGLMPAERSVLLFNLGINSHKRTLKGR